MGKRTDPARAQQVVERALRSDRAVALKLAGRSYRAIAAELGCCHRTAEQLVDEGLKAIRAENVQTLRKVQLERLEMLWAGITAPAVYDDKGRLISGGAVEGEPAAISAAVKVLERMARIGGTDAPTKLDAKVTGKRLQDMTDEEVFALKRELQGKVPA